MSLVQKLLKNLDRRAHESKLPKLQLLATALNYQVIRNGGYLESASMVFQAFQYVSHNKIKGDYAEFGVFRGRGIIEAFYASKKFDRKETSFLVFDSFEGLPEIQGADAGGPFSQGEFSYSLADFKKNVSSYGVELGRLKITQGFFDSTLKLELRREAPFIAIAWVDCDLYVSTVPVLDYLTDRLVDGAVICFDDWFCFNGGNELGEQKACAEWLEKNPSIQLTEYRTFHWAGKAFIFNRRNLVELPKPNRAAQEA
jgi:O-methyltransferase